jgi:RND family efflux transporter MFP subunit
VTPVPYLCCLFLGLAAATPAAAAEAATPTKKASVQVSVDAVRRVASDETVPLLGRVVALREGPIAIEVAGVVTAIRAEVGDRVKAGAPLFEIDPVPLRLKADVARAEEAARAAQVIEAKASARIAKSELERMEKLKNSAAFTPSRYEDKHQDVARLEAAAEAAEAARRIALANRKLAERDLVNAALAAPYDGVVIERRVDIGAYVAKGEAVFALINDRDIEVEADVPADLLLHFNPAGREIEVEITETRKIAGTVRARPAAREPAHPHPPDARRPAPRRGDPCPGDQPRGEDRLSLRTAARNPVGIQGRGDPPRGQDPGDDRHPEGAAARAVTLGASLGGRFAVIDGLAEGDLAVVRGNERLAPGTPLKYQEPR